MYYSFVSVQHCEVQRDLLVLCFPGFNGGSVLEEYINNLIVVILRRSVKRNSNIYILGICFQSSSK